MHSHNAGGPICENAECPLWRREQGVSKSAPTPRRKARISLPTCRHLGEDTGRRVPCSPTKPCKAKVFECQLHGECVQGEAVGMKSCRGCGDFRLS